MKTPKYFLKIITVVLFLTVMSVFAQDKPDTSNLSQKKMIMKHGHQKMHTMMHDSSNHHNMHDMMMKDSSYPKMNNNDEMTSTKKSPLIREGEIDLKAIDNNKDGKVYEDIMDYNVISDKPGKCPLCGMTLKEVTIKKAKEILLKAGFKVK